MASASEKSADGTIPPGIRQRFDQLTQDMDTGDLWNYEAQVQSILGVLGIHDMERPMGQLSGGMVKKVALAQVLVEEPSNSGLYELKDDSQDVFFGFAD